MLRIGILELLAMIALISGASAAFFAVADDSKKMAQIMRENERLKTELLVAEIREACLIDEMSKED